MTGETHVPAPRPEIEAPGPTPAQLKQKRNVLLMTTVAVVAVVTGIIGKLGPATAREGVHTFSSQGHPVLGDPAKGAQVVMFMDYNCPHCKEFDLKQLPKIKKVLVDTGKIHVVMYQSPFLAESSTVMAKSAWCAYQQGNDRFWTYHRLLMERPDPEGAPVTTQALDVLARRSSLDLNTLHACQTSKEAAQAVANDLQIHKDANMIGTPAVFVNGHRTPAGGVEIDQARLRYAAPTPKP